jgi:hypothetical protein
MSHSVTTKRLEEENSAGWTTCGTFLEEKTEKPE